jgi:hypothetical protein
MSPHSSRADQSFGPTGADERATQGTAGRSSSNTTYDATMLSKWHQRGQLLSRYTTTDAVCLFVGSQSKVPVELRVEVRPGPLLDALLIADAVVETRVGLGLGRSSAATPMLTGREEAYRRNWSKLFALDETHATILLPTESNASQDAIPPGAAISVCNAFREVCEKAGAEPHFAGLDQQVREHQQGGSFAGARGQQVNDGLGLLLTRHSMFDGVPYALHVPTGGRVHAKQQALAPTDANHDVSVCVGCCCCCCCH